MKTNAKLLGLALFTALIVTALGQTTETLTLSGLNRVVPDGNGSGMSIRTNIASTLGAITGLKVRLNVAGDFNGDLYAYLRHVNAQGTNFCVLLNRVGSTAANPAGYDDAGLDVTLDSGAANHDIHLYRQYSTPTAGTPLTGTWQPDGRNTDPFAVTDVSARTTMLTDFYGIDAGGEWTLFIADLESGGTNMLVSWELEITGRSKPTITWPNPADLTYGTALGGSQLNANASVPGSYAYSPGSGTVLNAGSAQTLAVTFTPSDLTKYVVVTGQVSINVLQKDLTIAVNHTNKVYGAVLPVLAATFTGFVNGDTTNSLTTQPALATTALPGSPVGDYDVSASGAVASNYAIAYTPNTLTVTPASLAITANNATKVYGTSLPVFSATFVGFVNSDTTNNLTTQPLLTTSAGVGTPVGAYPITASGAVGSNYTIAYVAGSLSVTPASLTITANNSTKVYGASLPVFAATFAGFVNNDTTNNLTAQPALTTTASAGSPVAVYPITASGAAGSNYNIGYLAGTLTVTPAQLTIIANNASKVYGAPLPVFSATFVGFVNSDTTNNLTSQPVLATTATASSPAGSYDITVSGAAWTNYTITHTKGTLTVDQANTLGALTSSSPLAQFAQNVTFTFQLSAVAPGAGTPTGVVQFKINNVAAGAPVSLVGGVATYATAALSAGTHNISAEYAGDSNFFGTTNSLAGGQVINRAPVAVNDAITRTMTNGAKVQISTLLGNDTDADTDAITLQSISLASTNGGTISTNGNWVYYHPPTLATTNLDAFSYTISDGRGGQATGWVLVSSLVDTTPSPNLTIAQPVAGTFVIYFDGIPGLSYRIQSATNAGLPEWLTLGSATADAFGRFHFTNTPPVGEPERFYRSVYP